MKSIIMLLVRKNKETEYNAVRLPQQKQLELPINWHRNYQKYKKLDIKRIISAKKLKYHLTIKNEIKIV